MKKLLTSILVLALLTGIFPGCTEIYQKAEAASGSYWLYGTRLTKKLGEEKGCQKSGLWQRQEDWEQNPYF